MLLEEITLLSSFSLLVNPIALRKAKIVYNFGLSECNRVKGTNFHLLAYILHLMSRFSKVQSCSSVTE